MLSILRSVLSDLTSDPYRTLALSLGPGLVLAVGLIADNALARGPGTGLDGFALAAAAMWLSVNWLRWRMGVDPSPRGMPPFRAGPVWRSFLLSMLIGVVAVIAVLPVAAIGFSVSGSRFFGGSEITVGFLLGGGLVLFLMTWLGLRLAPSFVAAASGAPFALRPAFAATRPQGAAILWFALGTAVVKMAAAILADMPGGAPANLLGNLVEVLATLLVTAATGVVAFRAAAPPDRAEVFA